ncbi:MAG: NfeD family protein [Solirubrobacteraceae bacterium]
MGVWVFWVVMAGLLGAGELHTGGFYLAPFAVGALAGALFGALGAGIVVSAVGFVAVSLLSMGALRPLARRQRRLGPALRTGAAALVGRPATVIERIANHEGVGCVKIDGEVWTARSYQEDDVIDTGERVEVVEIRGATALVAR